MKSILKRLAKWLVPHIIEEVQKELERKTREPEPPAAK